MTKSTAEAWMEMLSILGMIFLAVLAGMQILEPMAFLVGSGIIFVMLALGFKLLDKIDKGP